MNHENIQNKSISSFDSTLEHAKKLDEVWQTNKLKSYEVSGVKVKLKRPFFKMPRDKMINK